MKFTDFPLDGGLQEGLAEAGYITCMPVQEQVLQNGLEGADLYVQSQTGTGKTAAYLVTILQRLVSDPALSGKKALIMVPTRELAVQVEEEARILGSCMKLKSASFYGGVGYGHQQELLKKGVDVIIGTPGRVIDLQEQRTMDLSEVAFLVIDEADRMFDMGFYPDLRTLIKVLPTADHRQTMLFSATLNNWVKNLAWEYTIEAKEITIEAENVTVDEIEQMLYHVSSNEKMKLLLGLIENHKPESVIVFCNTKRMSEIVSKRLKLNGIESEFIIGDLPQSKRLQVIDSFKSGSLRCLVATDVAARGIDVDSLAMVINYDLPNEAENYVHRIGRTARAGKTGMAFSFCSEQDVYNLPAIEKYCESKIPSAVPTDELFVNDKSAGTYIRTDRYDSDYDDGDDRGGRGRPSSGGRGRPGGSRSGSSSYGGRGGDNRGNAQRSGGYRPSSGEDRPYEGRKRDDSGRDGESRDSRPRGPTDRQPYQGRSDANRRNDGRRDAPRRDGPRREDGQARAERDLSKLSFEERMAYYKNKYGSEEAANAAEGQRMAAAERSSRERTADNRDDRTADNRGGRADRPASARTDRKPRENRAGDTGGDRKSEGGDGRKRSGQGGGNRNAGGRSDGRNGAEGRTGSGGRDGTGTRQRGPQAQQGGRRDNAAPNSQSGGRKPASGAQNTPAKQTTPTPAPQKKGIAGFIKKLFGGK